MGHLKNAMGVDDPIGGRMDVDGSKLGRNPVALVPNPSGFCPHRCHFWAISFQVANSSG